MCELITSSQCPAGLFFDPVTKLCKDLYITNPNSANLVSDNITAYQQKYQTFKKADPKLQDCVNPAPYYDRTRYACVQCPSDFPYFNLESSKCQNCGDGNYNSEKSICEPKKLDY